MESILFFGIVISLLLTELTGFSPGGIVTAAYLALFARYPRWLAGTVLAALLTFAFVSLLGRSLLLYGRRQFTIFLLAGMLFGQFFSWFNLQFLSGDGAVAVIGYLIPGIIAKDFFRQGVAATLLMLSLAVFLTCLAALAYEGTL